jgi:hypothetical protein
LRASHETIYSAISLAPRRTQARVGGLSRAVDGRRGGEGVFLRLAQPMAAGS